MVIDLLLGDRHGGHILMKSVRDSALSGRWLPESRLDILMIFIDVVYWYLFRIWRVEFDPSVRRRTSP